MHESNHNTNGRVGGYEILGEIARGAHGVVYRARQPALNRVIALKRLEVSLEHPSLRQRFLREARLAGAMEHPNIVSVFDFLEHDRVPYIAMEYVARGSLRPWVGNLNELQALGVLDGMLAGLAHAQERGIAHRDLKPENVLLARTGEPKIADFGIAKAYTHVTQKLTATGLAVGTPRYMAPEQARLGAAIGPATDLYAVGMIAFELLSGGRLPYEDNGDPVALLYRHIELDAPALVDVDPRLAAWVATMLARDPAARPVNALAARRELELIASELHGPAWRSEAVIGAARDDALPDDVTVPDRYETFGWDGDTELPVEAPDAPDGPARRQPPLLIVGPDATVEVSDSGAGATLRHVARWQRPRRRSRRRRLHPAPLRFENHVDRAPEIASLGDAVKTAHAVNVYGDQAIGKTHVLVAMLRDSGDPVFLDGRGQSADDLLHTLYEEFYVTRTVVRDPRVTRHLQSCSAIVAVEDVALSPGELKHLLDGAPRCRFILTSRERVLWDGPAIKIRGLAPEFGAALAEQELGRELGDDDRSAAIAIATSLAGHPLRLRQAFSQARDTSAPLAALREELAGPPVLQDRLASLSELEMRVVRALAPYGGISVAGEHLRAVVSEPRVDDALVRLEQRHDVAHEDGRYRLLGVLAHALPLSDDLTEETSRAAAHFASWLEGQTVDSGAALADMPAVLALIERSFLAGDAAEAIRLGRAAEGHLSRRQRWAAWGLVLAIILASARDLDDGVTEGWALNQLGVRSLGAGRTSEAERLFEEAVEVLEGAGDDRGAAVPRGNLATLRRVPPPLPRASHGSPVALVGTFLILIAAVVGLLGAWLPESSGEPPIRDGSGRPVVTIAGGGGTVTGAGIKCPGGKCHKDRHLLAVAIDGRGSVLAGDRRCDAACRVRLPRKGTLRLTADPAPGWRFAGWAGDCRGGGRCRLDGARPRRVTARFVKQPADDPVAGPVDPGDPAPPTVQLTVARQGAGDGRVSVDGRAGGCASGCEFPAGTKVTLRAHHAAQASSVRWPGRAGCASTCEVVLGADLRVSVVFEPKRYKLELRSTGPGRVTCAPACAGLHRFGAKVRLTAVPAPGATFVGWRSCAPAGETRCEVRIGGHTSVSAEFRPPPGRTVVLTLAATGKGSLAVGGESCAAGCRFPAGRRVTIAADHDAAATAIEWSVAGCSGRECTLTLGADTTVRASFTVRRHQLDVNVDGRGSAACGEPCSRTYEHGETVAIRATDGADRFAHWNGCPNADGATCHVQMTEDRTVTAVFGRRVNVVTTADGPGGVTLDGRSCEAGCLVDHGVPVTLTATPAEGADVAWTGVACQRTTCSFSPTDDVTITARFTPRHRLTFRIVGEGTVRCGGGACAATYPAGTPLTLTAVAAAGWSFSNWDGCTPAGRTCTLTMDRARIVYAVFERNVR